jgi:hypothetical protein
MAIILTLDESVTDETLPKLGEMIFEVNAANNFNFGYLTNDNTEFTARIIGDGNFFTDGTYQTSAGTSVTQTSASLFLSSGHYKVGITQKYILRDIGHDFPLAETGAVSFDCTNLKYSEYTFSFHASHWNLSNFSGENLKNCVLINASGSTSFNVDVTEFKKFTSSLYSVNIAVTDAYGDVVDAFGSRTNLSLLACGTTQCTGTYQAVCDAMFANGRISGTMTISVNDGTGTHIVRFTPTGWSAG